MNNTAMIGKKVLLVGLGGVGKTSIGILLKTMNKDMAAKTAPSISVERYDRTFMGKKVNFFIAPGQKRFLWSLFKRDGASSLNRLLENADVIIYVVDSSDYNRMPEMFNYFKILIDKLVDIKNKGKIKDKQIILLAHKQDLPNAISVKAVEEFFVTPLKLILERNNIKVEVLGTTIYDPSSIVKVLYTIVGNNAQSYDELVKQLAIKLSAETVFLGDSEGILIALHGDYDLSQDLLFFFIKLVSIIVQEVPAYTKTVLNPFGELNVIFKNNGKKVIFNSMLIDNDLLYRIIIGIVNAKTDSETALYASKEALEKFKKL